MRSPRRGQCWTRQRPRTMADPIPMQRFTTEWSRARVVFGAGAVDTIGAEADALGIHRALLIMTPGRTAAAGLVRTALGHRLAGICDRATIHVPADRVRHALDDVERLA